MKNKLMLLISVAFLLIFSVPAFADEGWPENPDEVIIDTSQEDDTEVDTGKSTDVFSDEDLKIDNGDEGRRIYASYEDTIKKVSIDEVVEWGNRKSYEVIYLLQVFVQPFAILFFIISAFLTMVGSVSNGSMAGKGVWGMIISSVMYAVVLYAPLIMQTFVGWATS